MIVVMQTPCYVQDRQTLDPYAHSHIQPGPECLQAWGILKLLVQPVPVSHHALRENLPRCHKAMQPGVVSFPLLFLRSDPALEGKKMFSLGGNSGIRG